jgi:KDO2-lipid IV(A) lauroyltransferase
MTILGLGEPGVYDRLREHAANGGLIALLGDRDLSARGIDVDFFGSRARFPAGAAALAVDTGAALLPVSLFTRTGQQGELLGNAGLVLPEVTPPERASRQERIAATTQLVADSLAVGIREHPSDWHMLQKLWLADLDPTRLAAADAAGGR